MSDVREYPPAPVPEPPIGTWVKDRFGGTSKRQADGGWGQPGMMPFGKWDAMWEARGPLVICGPWGADLEPVTGPLEGNVTEGDVIVRGEDWKYIQDLIRTGMADGLYSEKTVARLTNMHVSTVEVSA